MSLVETIPSVLAPLEAMFEPPFEPAAGCRVVGRDPTVLDFVLRWWPVQDEASGALLHASPLKG